MATSSTGFRLTGAALISGGASGLGEATARRLSAEGMAVTIADRNAQLGESLAAELGDRASFVELDVTDPEAVLAAAHEAANGDDAGLRMTVACAGIGGAERLVSKRGTHSVEGFHRVVMVNLMGTFHLLRAGAEVMSANEPLDGERGLHVNTASVAAFDGQIGQLSYSASKGGIVGMTLPAARDLAQHGIRVCTIAPGLFETPLLAGLSEEARSSLGAQVPFPPRLGQPDEYAELVVSIARNQMLNGEVIRLDGAIRMSPR
jgi:NAD(P)-dependent dehydrogenase (short-subunit alcohol dehydrogenase family)